MTVSIAKTSKSLMSKHNQEAEEEKKEEEININVQYYNPKDIFSIDDDQVDLIGNNNFDLARAFYSARYNDQGKIRDIDGADRFTRNAGAVQLFNVNGINALSIPHHSISNPIADNKGNLSSWGHTERLGMRDALDYFIPENNGEIERPSYYIRSSTPADHPLEILQSLVTYANDYKLYLENQRAVVKMWSEREPCSTNLSGGGRQCDEFIRNIFPNGSQYGYITEVPKFTIAAPLIETASESFKNAYLDYLDPLGIISLFNMNLVGDIEDPHD